MHVKIKPEITKGRKTLRAVVQKVRSAKVEVAGFAAREIGKGLLLFIGIAADDTDADIAYIVNKCAGLRVFNDQNGVMNYNVRDAGGELLVVSQFTLMGDVRHGKRPSYVSALPPGEAAVLFDELLAAFYKTGLPVQSGIFAADMQVSLINDGPVTILLDSKKLF